MTDIDIYATINGINYKPRLCRDLKTFDFDDLGEALRKEASFLPVSYTHLTLPTSDLV